MSPSLVMNYYKRCIPFPVQILQSYIISLKVSAKIVCVSWESNNKLFERPSDELGGTKAKAGSIRIATQTPDKCDILTASQGIEVFCKLTERDEKSKFSLELMAKLN